MTEDIINNKYKRWYDSLIDHAICRQATPSILTETHHIIPRSLGGTDDGKNLAVLTLREHYVAHLLLSKMFSGGSAVKMAHALKLMSGNQKYYKNGFNSKKYELAKSLIRKIYQTAGQEYQAQTAIQSNVLSEYTDLEKVYKRGVCKICKIEPRAVNYIKNGKTYYRSKCESCQIGKVRIATPKWVFDGYQKGDVCEICNFKSKFREQLTVISNNKKYKTICLNCQVAVKLTPPKPAPDL